MDIEVSNSLYKQLKQVLLLGKEEENSPKSQKNVLAMLGLNPKSFPDPRACSPAIFHRKDYCKGALR